MNRFNRDALLAILLILVVVGFRFLPHPANFSPTLALLIYVGFVGRSSRALWLIGPALILVSDLLIGTYDGISMVYLSYAICLAVGAIISRARVAPLFLAGLSGSVLFFALSNFGVWQFTNLYPHDQLGLVQCYVMALPFFHYTVFSTVGGLAAMFAARTAVNIVVSKIAVE